MSEMKKEFEKALRIKQEAMEALKEAERNLKSIAQELAETLSPYRAGDILRENQGKKRRIIIKGIVFDSWKLEKGMPGFSVVAHQLKRGSDEPYKKNFFFSWWVGQYPEDWEKE